MTVIAANRQMMASDSLLDQGGVGSRAKKLWVYRGMLIGGCGSYADIVGFIEWLKKGAKGKPPRGDYECLVLYPDGRLTHYESGQEFPVLEKFAAIGAGQSEALAAMHCGRTPKQAVQITCRIRNDCGGRIQVRRVGDKR